VDGTKHEIYPMEARLRNLAYAALIALEMTPIIDGREHDIVPYRAVGPATKEEYESRMERYDKQLKEKLGIDPTGKSTEEKRAILRKYREAEYEKAEGCGLQAPRLDNQRSAHNRKSKSTRYRFPRRNSPSQGQYLKKHSIVIHGPSVACTGSIR